MRIFREIPFIKLQNDTLKTTVIELNLKLGKRWKMMKNEMMN